MSGIEAVRAIKDGLARVPIRLVFLAPSQAYLQNRMFGLKPAAGVSVDDLKEMLSWPGCYGLDETPFSSVVLDEDEGMLELFEAALAAGKVPTGHVSGASEKELQAFVAVGGMVDHEAVNVAEAIGRARAGMKVLMRFGSGVPDLPNLIGAYTEAGISARQLAVCTDVLLPETLAEGGLDVAVRRIIAAGVRPLEAIAMATVNVAILVNANTRFGPPAAPPQPEISSSARLVVRGPKRPIVAITTPIAAAMNTNTPKAPERASTKAMMNELKMTESRLHE